MAAASSWRSVTKKFFCILAASSSWLRHDLSNSFSHSLKSAKHFQSHHCRRLAVAVSALSDEHFLCFLARRLSYWEIFLREHKLNLRRCLPHYYAFYISAACLENDLMNKNSEPHKGDNLAWIHDKANPMLCQFPNHILSSVNFDSILLSCSNQTQTLFILFC